MRRLRISPCVTFSLIHASLMTRLLISVSVTFSLIQLPKARSSSRALPAQESGLKLRMAPMILRVHSGTRRGTNCGKLMAGEGIQPSPEDNG